MYETKPATDVSTNKTKIIIGALLLLVILGASAFILARKNFSKDLSANNSGNSQTNEAATNPIRAEGNSSSETSNSSSNSSNPEGPVAATPDTSGSDHNNPSTTTNPGTSTAPYTGGAGYNEVAEDSGNQNPTSTPPRSPAADTQVSGTLILQ